MGGRAILCRSPIYFVDADFTAYAFSVARAAITPPPTLLVSGGAGVSLEVFFQILVRLLRFSMARKPQRVGKGVRFGFPKLRPRYPSSIHKRVDDNSGMTNGNVHHFV